MDEEQLLPPTTLEEVYGFLGRFSLSNSLFVIGVVNAMSRYGFHKLDSEGLPAGTVRWVKDMTGGEMVKVFDLSLQLTRVARFLLLSAANDYKHPVLDTGTPQLRDAVSLVARLHDKEVEGEVKSQQDLVRVMGRIGQLQFPLQGDRSHIIGRGQLLFVEIPSELHPQYDFDQKMREHFGLGVLEYIATGLALWITDTGVLKHNMTVEVDELRNYVNRETVNKFVAVSTGTPEDYRRLLRGEDSRTLNKKLDIYGLDPFVQMPGIQVKHSLGLEIGSYIVPQPYYLLQKATMGLFYLLADKEREAGIASGKSGRNYFRDSFGEVYRAYVGRQLALAKTPIAVIDLDKEIKTDGTKPDFALVDGNTCVVFEVKTALLTVTPRTIFDEVQAREKIQQGSFKKALQQLDEFEEAVLAGTVPHEKLKGVRKVIKVVVGFDDIFLANAFLLPLLGELRGDKVENLQIATIGDIDMVGTTLANGGKIGVLMAEKVATKDTAEWSLAAFLGQKKNNKWIENPLLKKAFEDFMSTMTGKDFDALKDSEPKMD